MNCCCITDADYAEGPELYEEKIITARKQHKCCECSGVIEPGKKYHYVRGLWEGSFETFKTCMPCKTIRDEYCCWGFIFGELSETIYECLGVEL